MSFKFLFFLLAFSSLIMAGVLIKNQQEIELLRVQNENRLQIQLLIEDVCDGRGGVFEGTKLDCK